MPSCIVPGCKSSWKNSPDLKFHKFPRDSFIRLRWIQCIGVAASEIKPWSTVCGCHFQDTDYDRDLCAELTGMLYTVDLIRGNATEGWSTLLLSSMSGRPSGRHGDD